MLVEILLSLVGYTGDLVNNDYKLRHLVTVELLSSAEAENIESLVALGKRYAFIKKFVRDREMKDTGQQSLVLASMCSGLEEILQKYHQDICALEQKALQMDPIMPITKMKYILRDYFAVFKACQSLIERIKQGQCKGGAILKELYSLAYYSNADPVLQASLETLLSHCHTAWLHMLQGWLKQGILVDPYKEFFIEERGYKVHVPGGADESTQASTTDPLAGCSLNSGGWTEYDWTSKYTVRMDMVPLDLMDAATVAKVMFTGKAQQILQRLPSMKSFQAGDRLGLERFVSQELSALREVSLKGKIDCLYFENVVQRIYERVAQHLWTFIVKDANLVDNLKFVRDFYLLGRGEFYRSFIEESRALMAAPPRPTLAHAQHAIRTGPWREAAVQSNIDSWAGLKARLFNRLELHLTPPAIDFRKGFMQQVPRSGQHRSLNLSLNTTRFSIASMADSSTTTTAASQYGHAPSRLSDLVFVGDVRLQEPTNSVMMSADRCALWGRGKLPVERGFSSGFDCALSSSNAAIAFAVQHNIQHGPTALGTVKDPFNIPNSVCVRINSDAISIYSYDVDNAETVLATAKVDTPNQIQVGDRFHVRVSYELEGDISPKLFLSAQGPPGFELQARLDLHKTMTLERGSGRAWTGIVGRHARVFTWEVQGHCANDGAFADAWREMMILRFKVEWPLHLVLTREQLEAYGMVFQFLLAVKRVGEALKESWQALNESRLEENNENSAQPGLRMEVLRLRAAMAYLINNLQYHLQVDVIDTLQKILLDRIEGGANFERVIEAHQEFMDSLITQSFLHNKVIRNSLDTVLRRCLRFCTLVDQFVLGNLPPEGTFQDLSKSFARDATFLCALLTRMNSNLLLRIDFNGYFTRLSHPKSTPASSHR